MTKSISNFLAAILIGGAMLAAPPVSLAGKGDCGQPTSTGNGPKASDAQTILKFAVGQQGTDCTAEPCICDVNNSGSANTTDALVDLKKAVGQQGITLNCGPNCPPTDGLPCTSAEIITRPGSDLDSGWTGLAHNSDIVEGASVTVRPLRKCSTSATACEHDDDCPQGETCKATCDCNGDKSCEVTGPTGSPKCVNTLKDCNTNDDCVAPDTCKYNFGPPLPLVTDGTPVCVMTFFDSPFTGTADAGTGEALVSANLRSRVFTGTVPTTGQEANGGPCPVCGRPSQNPKVGDVFTCDGGQFPGATCTVGGTSKVYGGMSTDCPPLLGANVTGSGLVIRFSQVTTGTTSKTAQLPCKSIGFTGNPTKPGSNPKCLDTGALCSSNADCMRCTGDPTTACTSNANCTGKGTCAEAPDQPITCGFWCNCGFCDNNPSLPCFETSDCPDGQTCQQGTGSSSAQNAPQAKPNDCSGDKFICGTTQPERCATTIKGECTLKPWLPSCTKDADCSIQGGGTCKIEGRACFESRITRSGVPSPLGSYCSLSGAGSTQCTSNADCLGGEDICVTDSSVAQTVALFCVPATASGTVNSAGGITGPGAVRLNSFLKVCRCGDGVIGCDEQCDEGDTINGDGCDDLCQIE